MGQIFLAASLMARKGSYQEASRLLAEALKAGHCSNAEALDLQARIHAQQGSYLDAEACWRKAISFDGTNPAYAEALDRLRSARRPKEDFYRTIAVSAGLVIIMLLCWQTALLKKNMRALQGAASSLLAATREDINNLSAQSAYRNKELNDQLSALSQQVNVLNDRLSSRLKMMPTLADTAENRKATLVMRRRLSAFEKEIDGRLGAFQKENASADALLSEHISAIGTALDAASAKIDALSSGANKTGRPAR